MHRGGDAPPACWNDTRFRFVSAAVCSVRDVHITQGLTITGWALAPQTGGATAPIVCRAVFEGAVSV